MRQKKQLLRGILSLLILSKLIENPSYGYALEMEINGIIGDKLPRGTVYVILKYMEKKGLIRAETRSDGRRVNVYFVTETGMELLYSHVELLEKMKELISMIIESTEKVQKHL
ncbi:MAG: PadR family transcriptional regulator [Nitrososphaerota archaeon]|jgi:DNA-binding PadR family transcriptional regulator|nr:PadR family transcriptional regulator [Nitrososphaerota archaeon]MDG6928261.1 PadR family transcriptional regulator [Nitrososphaerota archaeon]MDG6930958.1 PadR family transcriptional regulator [Nitrososphaerota archaeon]MDG6932926.1 PadR family transcriptional regulator [Nitrososphaerota archaeon]MDG6936347.1 PadR family transcriptional regulator [Nitrososphaerota archaeon]